MLSIFEILCFFMLFRKIPIRIQITAIYIKQDPKKGKLNFFGA
jgi:hypothetical protein